MRYAQRRLAQALPMYLTKVSQKITVERAFETYPQRSKDELAWEHDEAKLLGGDMHALAEVAVEV